MWVLPWKRSLQNCILLVPQLIWDLELKTWRLTVGKDVSESLEHLSKTEPALISNPLNVVEQKRIDKLMMELDGAENRSKFGYTCHTRNILLVYKVFSSCQELLKRNPLLLHAYLYVYIKFYTVLSIVYGCVSTKSKSCKNLSCCPFINRQYPSYILSLYP